VEVQEILRTLTARGGRLRVAEDGRIGVEPSSVLTDDLRAAVRANRDALVKALRPESFELAGAPVVETREQIGAVRLRSPKYGDVWVVLEPSMALELVAEEAAQEDPCPVLLAEDVVKLRGKSEEMIHASLAVLAVFSGARLIQ
jgi:hypothetical protein